MSFYLGGSKISIPKKAVEPFYVGGTKVEPQSKQSQSTTASISPVNPFYVGGQKVEVIPEQFPTFSGSQSKTLKGVEATPDTATNQSGSAISGATQYKAAPAIKTATPDIVILDDETFPEEALAALIFENIGGQELLNISRSDIINGQKISYSPIKNLASIQQQFNSRNIISLDGTSDKYFSGFSIKLEDKTPISGNGENEEFVYIDPLTGDLVVEAVNLQADERIEIEIIQNGTIYDIELGQAI